MSKKVYSDPTIEKNSFIMQDVVLGSPENFSGYIDDGDDWGDIDPSPGDDEIVW